MATKESFKENAGKALQQADRPGLILQYDSSKEFPDSVKIKSVNEAFREHLDNPEVSAPVSFDQVLALNEDSENHFNELDETKAFHEEIQFRGRNHEDSKPWYFAPVNGSNGKKTQWLGISLPDSTSRYETERLEKLAYRDGLTDLPNRELFFDRIRHQISRAQRHDSKLALIFLDLDRFKEINDTLGHLAGDTILKELSDRLENTLRSSDTIARFGGDEFTLLLTDIDDRDSVRRVAHKIFDVFNQPFKVKGNHLQLQASLGISIYPEDGDSVETLLRKADDAMYQAKESETNSYQFHVNTSSSMDDKQFSLKDALNKAVEKDELSLRYQPEMDVQSETIFGAEGLIRWDHPDHGLLEPSDFLPFAKMSGQIQKIENWVSRALIKQVSSWKQSGLNPGRISLNISAQQFRNDELIEQIESLLNIHNLAPSSIAFEMDESVIMQDVELSNGRFSQLNSLGCYTVIDDFGESYSSPKYLAQFDPDMVKISPSLMETSPNPTDGQSLLDAIVALAHEMELPWLLKGVENADQLKLLHDHNGRLAQGNLLSKPLPAERFESLLRNNTIQVPA